jgi:hypothetical protein
MRVNLRARDLDRAGPLVVRENQSRRDPTKVAEYEVLGNEAKNGSVPSAFEVRDDRNDRLLVSCSRVSDCQHSSIVPSGTNCSLKTLTQHFVLGYFH